MVSRIRRINRLWVGGLVTSVLLVAMTVNVFAAASNKTFKFRVSPTFAVQGTSQNFSLLLTNTSPGPSNISSFQVIVPSQFTVSSTPVLESPPGSSNSNSKAVVSFSANTINVTGLDPIKSLQFATLTIPTAVRSGLTLKTCLDGSGNNCSDKWVVRPWSGTALNGDLFVENSAGADLNSHTTALFQGTITCGETFSNEGTDVELTPVIGTCSFPITVTASTVSFPTPQDASSRFELTIAWGLPMASVDPYGGDTTFTVNGTAFTPNGCALDQLGAAQYPQNPKNGVFWPTSPAEEPWCLKHSTTEAHNFGTEEIPDWAYQVTEVFLGAGDPSITRCSTCR
jgi:hypothetical protein